MVLSWWERIFGVRRCAGCEARDYHIASLKEEIHRREDFINVLEDSLEQREVNQYDIIRHMTGMNRTATPNVPGALHSIPRRTGSIQERIRRAEQAEADPTLQAQRRKEYNDRINSEQEVLGPIEEVKGY